MSKHYDYIILGSGPGGSRVANGLNELGHKVAVVDSFFGGTCALRGCTPKKAMESVTSAYWTAKNLSGAGLQDSLSPVDWSALIAHKDRFTASVPHATKANFTERGIDIYENLARFTSPTSLRTGDVDLTADQIVIATGSQPRPLDFPGADLMSTSADFFHLDKLPERIVIVGGGYIAFELAHIAAACGSHVTIVSSSEMPFDPFHESVVKVLLQATMHKGIHVLLGHSAIEVTQSDGSYKITTQRADTKTQQLSSDIVIHAAGRTPNVDNLQLDAAGIELIDGGVAVDPSLRVIGSQHIYAVGDVINEFPFTETATYEADILLKNAKRGSHDYQRDYTGLPMCVHTHPKMAMVGPTIKEIDKNSDDYTLHKVPIHKFFTNRAQCQDYAKSVLITDEQNRIAGAHIIAPEGEHMINLLSLAIQNKMTTDDLSKTLLAYPSATHDIKYLW